MCPKLSHFSKSWLVSLRTENISFISLLVSEELAVFARRIIYHAESHREGVCVEGGNSTDVTLSAHISIPSSTPHTTPTTTEKESAAGFGPCVTLKPPQNCQHMFLYQQEQPPLYKNTLPTGILWRWQGAAHPQSHCEWNRAHCCSCQCATTLVTLLHAHKMPSEEECALSSW